MKKLLAYSIALTMSAMMFAGCGDSGEDKKDSSAADTTTTSATTAAPEESETEEETTTTAAEESKAEETTTTAAEEPAAPAEAEGLDVMVTKLKNYENASLKFQLDTDISQFVSAFNQENTNKLIYKDADGNEIENPYAGETHTPGELGYGGNEATMEFSVQDVGGIPMLKIAEVPSVWKDENGNRTYEKTDQIEFQLRKWNIDMDKLFAGHEEELPKIFSVKVDLVAIAVQPVTNEDGSIGQPTIYWLGGEFGSNDYEEWTGNFTDFSMGSTRDDAAGWADQWATNSVTGRILKDGAKFGNEDAVQNYLFFQIWANTSNQLVDVYVADITFEDEEGNVIPVPEENIPGGATYEAVDPLALVE